MRIAPLRLVSLLVLGSLVAGCGGAEPPATGDASSPKTAGGARSAARAAGPGAPVTAAAPGPNPNHLLLVGASKRAISPTDEQIAGIDEPRAFGAGTHKQYFNLGGFGINVGQNTPDPLGEIPAQATTTEPATSRVFRDKAGVDEHTYLRLMAVEQPGAACDANPAQGVPGTITTCSNAVVFVMMDAIGAGNLIQAGVKNAIVEAAAAQGVTLFADNILFGLTHSHTAADLQGLWGGVPQDWIQTVLYKAAGEAATEAFSRRVPARLSFRQGYTSDFNNYRRPRIDPNADADGTITLLTATAEDGAAIGSILQYNAHPTSVGDDNKPRTPHSEYVLGAMDWIEGHVGGTSLYFNGPIADASPAGGRPGCVNAEAGNSDPRAEAFGSVRCRGEGIADYLLHPQNVISGHELQPTLTAMSTQVVLPVTNPAFLAAAGAGSFNRYYNFSNLPTDQIPGLSDEQKADLPQVAPVAITAVSRITLGGAEAGLEIVSIPGETTNTTAKYIRSLAKTNVMLMGLTHNSFGYILPEEEFSYIAQDGDDGFVAPFTGYEEYVSMGPLTSTLLRSEGYNPLFGVPARNVPPAASSCSDSSGPTTCALLVAQERVNALIRDYQVCAKFGLGREGCPTRGALGYMTDGLFQIADGCSGFGGPEAFCGLFSQAAVALANTGVGAQDVPVVDARLLVPSADAEVRGCDMLDGTECLFPFPNDWFTVPAAPGSPQARNLADPESGGTGRRVNFNILAMPRNSAGKPVDPTEWNRNDGFSPGAMIVTYVPGIATVKDANHNPTGPIVGAAPITDIAQSLRPDAPIAVLDADTGLPHPIWAEIDLNANLFLHGEVVQTDFNAGDVERPLKDGRAALIIRPAKNFIEGHRYVVVLRNLHNDYGEPLPAGPAFTACRDYTVAQLAAMPAVQARCAELAQNVFPVLARAGVQKDSSLYLAWDFTAASARNNIGRLAHMRDVAFNSLASQPGTDCTQLTDANAAACASPKFTVEKVTENPRRDIARRIEGSITVPSFVTPVEPTPGDNAPANAALIAMCASIPAGAPAAFVSGCQDLRETGQIGQGATLPPNRLFYRPDDGVSTDASQAPYGDGMPDTVGAMSTPFTCMIPSKAFAEPARASIYGHGLLDSRAAVTYEGSPEMEGDHNFMYCAVDLFGFATGDLGNVASALADLSQFAVIPDGSQQGLLNYMFLARAMAHPQGFLSNPAFQNSGKPLFDRREIFYNGNSQGGIVGGAVLAISKDVNHGVLGSLGMNYSTLLQRSKDYDPYSTALYAAYTDPLDRVFLYSAIQMLWDRSENNGYAEHLSRKSAIEGGPVDHVLLNAMYGDQQVTPWSADVMARTMDIPVDYGMVTRAGKHHPDVVPGALQPRVAYTPENGAEFSDVTSALFEYAANETDDNIPIGNVPHRAGPDPHDNSHRRRPGRCQLSHWLQRDGRLLNINTARFSPESGDHDVDCPAIRDNSGAPGLAGTAIPPAAIPGAVTGAVASFGNAIAVAASHLAAGEFQAALDTLVGNGQQLVADAGGAAATQAGQAAGIYQNTPVQGALQLPPAQPLRAGAAKGQIRVPVGTPLGGYLRPPVGGEYIGEDPVGELADNVPAMADGCDPSNPSSCPPLAPIPDELRKIHSPYATYSPPSRGYYDSLLAKAVAMYDGHDYVVMVKTDFIGMLDELVQDVKKEVKSRKGIDLGDGLIMSATHTHDGPGAVANNSTRYFWLAMDAYQHDVYRRVVGDLATVVVAALEDMRPAKVGHATGLENLGMNHYRRSRMAYYKDNDASGCNWADGPCTAIDGDDAAGVPTDANELRRRIGVIRVDDAQSGLPIALVVNYAAHGIAFDVENQYFSGDILASLEREVEQGYARPAGAGDDWRGPVAMLIQNTTGDVTPSADYSIRGIEQWGKKIAPEIRAIADRVADFDGAPDLRTVSQRIVLSRKALGYKEDEYPYPWGGVQCGNDIAVPFVGGGVSDVPGYDQTGGPSKFPYCIFATPPDANDLADNGVAENGAFVPGDTILTATKIGGMTLIANPGEPLTEYGVRMLEMAKGEGYAPRDTFIWGYTGDHIGYILPPVREDWEQFGGAESTTTFWGWKQGARFIDVQKTLLDALRDRTAAPADEFQVDYAKYRAAYDAKPPVKPTPSLLPGSVIAQPKPIQRFGTTSFVFEGGDPVVDFPQVTMMHADGTPVRRANGEIVNTMFEMHLKYRLVTGRHQWTVQFESPKDWVAGSYRFDVKGIANRGTDASYTLSSASFAVTPAQNLAVTGLVCASGHCSADLKYAAAPKNYRIVDYRTPASQAAPVRGGTITFTAGGTSVVATTDDNGHASADIGGAVSASGKDVYGNTAPSVAAPASDGDADGDGVPDSSDQCPTEAGPSSSNGCPASAGFPLCEPFAGYCLSDIPGVGPALQGAVDMLYGTVTGGGAPDAGSLPPDACDPSGLAPDGSRCFSDLPVAGDQFGREPFAPTANASCAANQNLGGGRSYQVQLTSASGKRISFQVMEPTAFNCGARSLGAHPLMLHGHGFGGSRSTTGFADYRNAGYAVISIDQRGFGDSNGTLRVMDPDFEGRDLVQILDWAEANLDYLAYRNEITHAFVARPANGASTEAANLVVGAQGGSYGGGYQFLLQNVDAKNRLDALAPDVTWHDLRWSLNPGDAVKSGFGVLLSAGGDAGSYPKGVSNRDSAADRGLDPFIDEALVRGAATGEFPRDALAWFNYHSPAYWCGLNNEPAMPVDQAAFAADPNAQLTGIAGDKPGSNRRTGQKGVDVLLSQGFRDTLFNFNDAWWNYQCGRVRGGDVRLITHQAGHILNPAGLVSGAPSTRITDIQAPGQSSNCGSVPKYTATLQFFEEKLHGAAHGSKLAPTDGHTLCLSLSEGDAVLVPEQDVLAPRAASFTALQQAAPTVAYLNAPQVVAANVPHGIAAQAQYAQGAASDGKDIPTVAPILTVTSDDGVILAGIPQADLTVSGPGRPSCPADVPTARTGCDAIVFVGLGVQGAGQSGWTLIDDQVRPVRGLGAHASVALNGVAERLHKGDTLALLVYGYNRQFLASYSRDATLPVVDVTASLKLPLYATGADRNPDFAASAANSVQPARTDSALSGDGGVIGMLRNLTADLGRLITAAGNGDRGAAQQAATDAATGAADDAQHLGDSPTAGGVTGTDEEPAGMLARAASAKRDAEPVVITGASIPSWSVPEARGVPYPYPSGAVTSGQVFDRDPTGTMPGQVRNAHNGYLLYPARGQAPLAGVPVNEIAAYAFKDGAWHEIPVQVDERMPYFLANANSGFSVYSGTDQELTYVWDTESWGMTAGTCTRQYDPAPGANNNANRGVAGPTQDPVPGLDNDDEIVFMAGDAGEMGAGVPDGVPGNADTQQVTVTDPLDPASVHYVYLFRKPGGSSFRGQSHYVHYQRDADADQWVDRSFWSDGDPQKLGTSNTGYGPNLSGTVCADGTPATARPSNDRFPRDGVTVSTDAYRWHATGRWMVREMHVAKPGQPRVYGADLLDRWKGRAFQQSPDTNVSVVGFEDEQVNWEANSALLGERAGPVRAIREVWGADSGTNVTKTETFYRDAVAYRYHVRVHPIPPDGLYTAWDYNRGAMLPTSAEAAAGVPGGRYFTALRPRGVPVDGINDDIGSVDSTAPIPGIGPNGGPGCFSPDELKRNPASGGIVAPNAFGVCPVFFDAADPTFNLPLAFDNWEQVSGKGDLGSLVYTFENKGNTSYLNPLVVPYYRDDACLDDGTGDDPVQRPYPGERSDDSRVIAGYRAANGGKPYGEIPCSGKQGAYAAHGIHYFATHDTDNAFSPVTSTEIDGQQWQFAVPTDKPKNVAEPYANTVRAPLQVVVTPVSRTGSNGDGLTAALVFEGFPQGTPSLTLQQGLPLAAKATVRRIAPNGDYLLAADRLMTLVLELDCGGQSPPAAPCNSGGTRIARSQPVRTDANGEVAFSVSWKADAWGAGLQSLFEANVPASAIHVMLVDNGGDLGSTADNQVVHYSPLAQGFLQVPAFGNADATDDSFWQPVLTYLNAGSSGDGFTAALVFDGAPQGTPALNVQEGAPVLATATIRQLDANGDYLPAADRLVTLVLEVDCGGQTVPDPAPCNAGGTHIARSQPARTDANGVARLGVAWQADAWGSGVQSLFAAPAPGSAVHVMVVDNGADLASVSDNHVMNYSPAAQAMLLVPSFGKADNTDDQYWAPLGLLLSSTPPAERGLAQVVADFIGSLPGLIAGAMEQSAQAMLAGVNNLVAGITDLFIGNDHASVVATAEHVVNDPAGAARSVPQDVAAIVNGWSGEARGRVFAGVGVVDMTPDVGYGAGQYSDETAAYEAPSGGDVDPYLTGKKQHISYGVMSRLTGRAIVIEGSNGKRVALLKSDNYLAQDNLGRRIGQILEENGSSIGYDQILYGVTHAHSTSYYSGSAGVAAFQDAFDPRFFEFQARRLAEAILIAEKNLAPARMGATTVRHKIFKGQIMHASTGDDGTPVGYPDEYGDHGLVVMRIETDEAQPRPIAVWVNWGEHPEGLDGYDLHSADYMAFLERFVERDIGAPLVFSQGDVGSSEQEGNQNQRMRDAGTVCEGSGATPGGCPAGQGVWRQWNHKGYVQNERNVRFLADAVVKGWNVIGDPAQADAPVTSGVLPNNYVPEVQLPLSNAFPVDYRNAWVPGPLSHPYPDVSACRTGTTVGGNPGVPNAADCTRPDTGEPASMLWETMKAEGLPVPENYDLPSFLSLEENARLKLQVVRLGDMVLGSCACEAQVDLILNFESRANDVPNDVYDGFDWACVAEDKGELARDAKHAAACELQREKYFDVREFAQSTPGLAVLKSDAAKLAHMRAQVHNAADGWDSPLYVPYANAEPVAPEAIKGNFTKEELPSNRGYKLAVGIGHAGDYNGYTVSYREYMSHDHYRKALTSYGPHTADYMVTRLVRMAGAMKGAPELKPEPHDAMAQADEARQVAETRALGAITRDAYEAYYAALPPDLGPAKALAQPGSIPLFSATTFTWQGGATAIDNPRARVEKCEGADDLACTGGAWKAFAGGAGEVQTRVEWPKADSAASVYAGQFPWKWTANFEAYESFPARLGGTPAGAYRFVVDGCINDASAPDVNIGTRIANFAKGLLPGATGDDVVDGLVGATPCRGGASAYHLASNAFAVKAAADLVTRVTSDANGSLTIDVAPRSIPRTYASSFFPYLHDDNGARFCRECSFRPWASSNAAPASVSVTIGSTTFAATGSGTRWTAVAGLAAGQTATVTATYADGRASLPYMYTRPGSLPTDGDGDGIPDASDNCPAIANAGQEDNDGDHVGNACDSTPDGAGAGPGAPVKLCDPTPFDAGCASDLDGGASQGLLDTVFNSIYDTLAGLTGGGTPDPVAVLNDPLDPALFNCTHPAKDAEPNTPEYAFRDAENVFCSAERHQETMKHPANIQYMADNYGGDPYRDPALNAGKRFRHAELNIAGLKDGMSYHYSATNADVYLPCTSSTCTGMPAGLKTYAAPYPIAIVMHGAASDKRHLEWVSQPLAERGYFVVAVNGTDSTVPATVLGWLFDPANPYKAELDLTRIGTVGHSLGAENATRVQGDARVSGIVAFDPCDGSGANECKNSAGSKLHNKGAAALTPTLFLTGDYLGFPGYPQPRPKVDGDLRLVGETILRANGVDTMLLTPRATTHLDWAGAFTFGSRWNESTSLYYTLAWFDRYVKGKLNVDAGGNAIATQGRTEAQERAFRQGIVDDAYARLTADTFDGSVDLHNISQGRYDAAKAAASMDPVYGGNVPYRSAGLDLKERLSFDHRSVCTISRPDLINGSGTRNAPVLARADTTDQGDMRKTGCH